ncbi:MAG: 1-acyl-sn-glycerol-3-phosphate acyltransferase [Sphingomonadales bacterium]|nr:1-acyl-sn-glycerol-3-phosphate acyltransferase [Sphingomonadales bacterium]
MALRSIARADVAGTIRLALRLTILVLALVVAVPLHLICTLLRMSSSLPRLFLKSVARITGAVMQIHGVPLRSDVFYVSNHVSWLDIPVLAGATGAAFVAQAEIAGWPLIGWLATLNRTIFITRADRMTVARQVEILRDALDHHQPVVVFPEGTTSDGLSLLPFKPSLFAVVTPPPRPMMIQPILIDYGAIVPDYAWINDEAAGANAMRLLRRPGTFPVRVHFLQPIDPGDFPDRKSIAVETRKRIADALSASLGGIAIV